VADYANVLVKVVAIFGVINRVSATTSAHNIFCYSTVAHILSPSANLAFRPKSGLKYKCRARAEFGLVTSDSDRVQASKWVPFATLCGCICRGQQGELKGYILHPPTVKICWNHFVK